MPEATDQPTPNHVRNNAPVTLTVVDIKKLHGNLSGFHSIRVNRQWRLIFQWDGGRGEAADVYLDDHSYV